MPLKTLSIIGVNTEDEGTEAAQKSEEETSTSREVILDRPIHDTGNPLYGILSFFLPILGLIAAYLFRRHNYIRNYKVCRKGALAFFACVGVCLLLFAFLLIMAEV